MTEEEALIRAREAAIVIGEDWRKASWLRNGEAKAHLPWSTPEARPPRRRQAPSCGR